MNFVKNHNQFGVEAKEIPCLVSHGEPTEETKGAVGCLYMDEDTENLYKCVSVSNGAYVWKPVSSGSSMTLLWENPYPDSDMDETTITIPNLSEYEKVEIVCVSGATYISSHIAWVHEYGEGVLQHATIRVDDGEFVFVLRDYAINADANRVWFSCGKRVESDSDRWHFDHTTYDLVPYRIYGVSRHTS